MAYKWKTNSYDLKFSLRISKQCFGILESLLHFLTYGYGQFFCCYIYKKLFRVKIASDTEAPHMA